MSNENDSIDYLTPIIEESWPFNESLDNILDDEIAAIKKDYVISPKADVQALLPDNWTQFITNVQGVEVISRCGDSLHIRATNEVMALVYSILSQKFDIQEKTSEPQQ